MNDSDAPLPAISLYERIYAIVRQIPRGRVATYGQVALLTGGCSARTVGFAMAALHSGSHPDVPWFRVINRQGRISITEPEGGYMQRQLLENEGVIFNRFDQVDLEEFGWLGAP